VKEASRGVHSGLALRGGNANQIFLGNLSLSDVRTLVQTSKTPLFPPLIDRSVLKRSIPWQFDFFQLGWYVVSLDVSRACTPACTDIVAAALPWLLGQAIDRVLGCLACEAWKLHHLIHRFWLQLFTLLEGLSEL
jgi:hypothetical protein